MKTPFYLFFYYSLASFKYLCSSRSMDGYNRAYFNKKIKSIPNIHLSPN